MNAFVNVLDVRSTPAHNLTNVGQEADMDTINLYEAKTHLSGLVERAAAGEEIVIAKAGRPLARLVPLAKRTTPRPLGSYAGQVWVGPDFEDPLPGDILQTLV